MEGVNQLELSSVGVKGSRYQLKQAARKTSQAATSLYNQGKCQKYDSVYNNLWLSSSFSLEEVIEMNTVLSDCYYCCTSPMCLCREPRDAYFYSTNS